LAFILLLSAKLKNIAFRLFRYICCLTPAYDAILLNACQQVCEIKSGAGEIGRSSSENMGKIDLDV
jgi:hypothetical protein